MSSGLAGARATTEMRSEGGDSPETGPAGDKEGTTGSGAGKKWGGGTF